MKARQDILIFLLLLVFSAPLLVGAGNLGFGSGLRMGSGSFPRLVGWLGVILALCVLFRLVRQGRAGRQLVEKVPDPVGWRALGSISGALLAFALLIRDGGLVPAGFATVLCATFAQRYDLRGERLVLAAGLTTAAVLVFVEGLGLPFRVWPASL